MRIDQAYVSQSVNDFDWFNRLNVKPYYDSMKPCLFIGVYSDKDIEVIKNHHSKALILWCGYDSMMWDDFDIFKRDNVINITGSKIMQQRFKEFNVNTVFSNPCLITENIYQQKTGHKIFAYCPVTSNDYHRMDIISELQLKYDIILADNKYNQEQWHQGAKYEIYNECYIGLVLNNYCGGAQTIMELSMQGKYCVTNTQDFDNCLSCNSIEDIENHINNTNFKQLNENLVNFNKFYKFEPEWLYIN